jgi:hypothetical protein
MRGNFLHLHDLRMKLDRGSMWRMKEEKEKNKKDRNDQSLSCHEFKTSNILKKSASLQQIMDRSRISFKSPTYSCRMDGG